MPRFGRDDNSLGRLQCREGLGQFPWGVDEDVGVGALEGVRGEAVGDADAPEVGVAGGEDVNFRVADHDGFVGLGVGFGHQGLGPERVRFLGFEAIAAVSLEEMLGETESGEDVAGGADGFVGEDGHLAGAAVANGSLLERFGDSSVNHGGIELVVAIIEEEEIEGLLNERGVGGIAESAADEHGGAVADVGVDDFERQFFAAEVAQHGVDRGGEVFLGIDQGAVEIKQNQLNFFERDGPKNAYHVTSSIKSGRASHPFAKNAKGWGTPESSVVRDSGFGIYNRALSEPQLGS